MMRRHARSENPKIVRKLRSAQAAAGSVSRAFPRRAAPSLPMPALRSRSQTRVCVAKAVGKAGGSDVRRLLPRAKAVRSGKKPQAFSEPHGKPVDGENEWARVFGGNGADDMSVDVVDGASDKWNGPSTPETDAAGIAPLDEDSVESDRQINSFMNNKRFDIFYSRKRSRIELSDDAESVFSVVPVDGDLLSSERFVNTYTRRKKLKIASLSKGKYLHQSELEPVLKRKRKYGREVMISDSSLNLARSIGILKDDILTSLVGRMVLIVLVDSSCNNGSNPLSCILSFVRSWMNRGRFKLWILTAHLLSGSSESVTLENGIHLLPLRWPNNLGFPRNSKRFCGFCMIYGACQSVPLLCLDFLALPSYFKWLHTSMLLGSCYLPCTLRRYLRCLCSSLHATVKLKKDGLRVCIEKSLVPESSVMRKHQDVIIALESVIHDGRISSGSKYRQLRRRRSYSRRQTRSWDPLLPSSQAELFAVSNAGTVSDSKVIILPDLLVEPLHLEVPETSDDFISYKDESDVSTPVGSHEKCTKPAKKSPVDPIKEKEFRTAMVDVKQNILSASCKANVLVTVADRCWREEGFDVTLDVSTSQGWCIAVKSQSTLRYLHEPKDMKPCVVNRFTHTYMWQGEDGWKLEFPDRWDWSVFKELHSKCREHNLTEVPTLSIPVPGVQEVSGYENYAAAFVRPDGYIRVPLDEVQRSLESEVVLYDMDSADEDWLKKFNSVHAMGSSGSPSITEEEFEKIICLFEKAAYSNLNDVFDKETFLEPYQDFGNADALSSIYDYWIKKRTKKHAALIRIFQGSPMRRPVVHNTHLRKKRSSKRHRSQSARTKHEAATEGIGENQKALQRIQDAQSAAKKAMGTAIQLRDRAQTLMKHAELAAYKSVMALRIAEALQALESPNVASILD